MYQRAFDIRLKAREALAGKWGMAVVAFIIYMAIASISMFIPLVGPIVYMIICGPLFFGFFTFYLHISRGSAPNLETIFEGFKSFGKTFLLTFLFALYTFLWFLLLVIPGYVACFSYMMSYFILADNPHLSANEAIKKSKEMMKGHKWRLFCLFLSFIGWMLLCYLTLGIGFLWLCPYMYTATGVFYNELKEKQTSEKAF